MPHPSGAVWWFANPPRRKEPSRNELRNIAPEEWRAELNRLFAGDRGPALDIIRHTERIAGPWPTQDVPSVPAWDRGRIADHGRRRARHVSGQGASMAIEDALVLATCLRAAPGIPAAFADYERARRKRVEAVVKQGKRNGSGKAAGPVGRVIRDRVIFPLITRSMARRSADPLAWIHDYRVDWDARARSVRSVIGSR